MFATQVALASDITEISCTTLKNCYSVFSHTRHVWPTSPFPPCVLANWAAGFLLKTGDTSWKLQLCYSVLFLLCVLTPALYVHFQACFLELLKLWKPRTLLQFDDPEQLEESRFDIMLEVKCMVRRLTQFVRVDPAVFCPQEQRLTAEFSREKIYLWVDTE